MTLAEDPHASRHAMRARHSHPALVLSLCALLPVAAMAAAHGGEAAAVASVVQPTTLQACGDRQAWPTGALPAGDAMRVDAAQFISGAQLETWGEELDRQGLRATGNAEHARYIEALAARLRCAGVHDVHTEPVTFKAWTPGHWALAIASGPAAGVVKVAGYGPYTGATPAKGITAPLAYLSPGSKPERAEVAGHIVLVDVPKVAVPYGYFRKIAYGLYDVGSLNDADIYTRPYLGMAQFSQLLDALQAAGAAGVVAIHPGDFEAARGAYFPFDHVFRKVPTLFVDQTEGKRLESLATAHTRATLTLTARVAQTTTYNVIGTIPGASDEITLLSSHTDGTNGVEDNGPDAIIGMAQYLSRLPRKVLPRSVMVMLDCCHFINGAGVEQFVKDMRANGKLVRIAANITIEHLAARDFEPDASGALVNTGRYEPSSFYLPPIPALADAAYDALRNADIGPATVLPPSDLKADGHKQKAWPGDGQNFWAFARIPTANFATGPWYLLNGGMPTADKIDYDRMHREMIAFTQMLLNVSRIPRDRLDELSVAPIHTAGSSPRAPKWSGHRHRAAPAIREGSQSAAIAAGQRR